MPVAFPPDRSTGAVQIALAAAALISMATIALAIDSAQQVAALYSQHVDRHLDVPETEQRSYAAALERALQARSVLPLSSQFIVVVDRSPHIQAVMLFWRSSTGESVFIGASPTSTGRPSGFEHFETPLGVFDHSIANLDFRAEGTRNELGVCGYGVLGMRVYDFGWVEGRRGWGKKDEGTMRLQMHATDARFLEPRLGTRQSKGCIRIPATLNQFFDQYGILDADYERALAEGHSFWVLRPDREPTPWSGRFLIVIETSRASRPDWARPAGPRKP